MAKIDAMKFEWVYAYDRGCRKINETFGEMFEQKKKTLTKEILR